MSDIVPPDARADHRHGPGHGGPVHRDTTGPRGARAALLRACVLPAAAMALLGGATEVFLRVATPSVTTTRLVFLAAAATAAAILAAAYAGADAAARSTHDQLLDLRPLIARCRDELCRFAEGVKRGDHREPPNVGFPAPATTDPFELIAHDLRLFQGAAQRALLEAANPAPTLAPGSDQRVEVFVNLAWRMQSMVHREIQLLDELEAQVEDPDLLKGLFTVDHLATLLRRQTENLAVLGGAASRRRWSSPVTMYDVLRSAVAEVEQYSRVKLVLPIEGMLHGDAVAHIVHLVAELVENATKFSPPETQVLIRAENVAAGLAIEVEDRGLGIPPDDRHRMNDVLADPGQVNIGDLLRDGRIGLFVVSALAQRHGVRVELQRNIYGGIQAVIVLPKGLVHAVARNGSAAGPANPAAGPAVAAAAVAAVAAAATAATAAQEIDSAAHPDISAPVRTSLPAETVVAGPGSDGERPPLPQRRIQQNLAPQLREAPVPLHDESIVEPTPGLMADFLRGVGRSDGEDNPDGSDGAG